MEHQPETHKAIGHLDFTPTCSVGHPNGLKYDSNDNPYQPCLSIARFVADVHGHPEDKTYFWCIEHLTQHTIMVQRFVEDHDRTVCLQCGHQIAEIQDLIYNLHVIDKPENF